MSDVNANIGVHIDTSQALSELKSLQRQLATFYSSISKSSAAAVNAQRNLQLNLLSNINATGQFATSIGTIRTSTEAFTNSLEKNKFSMREYFRYAGGATKTFGSLFKNEFDTIGKVAEDRVKKLQTQYIKIGRDASGAMKAIAITPNKLDLTSYNTQSQLAAQRQALFNQLVKQGSTNLLNFGKNTQWAGRQLMVGFSIPLASLGVTAAKTFMDMETAAIKFKKVYGDLTTTPAETNQALSGIKELAKTYTQYGVAVKDTISLAADAAAAGYKGIDLQNQTNAATKLSVLGQIDNQKALQTTISLQNAFGISTQDLAGTIDFLNAVENQTVTSLDDITTAIPKAAPVVKQLGGSVKDLAFFLTAMKQGGVNASEGANALKSGLSSLINPSKKASDMLASVGISVRNIVDKNRGDLKATVIEFAKALDTLNPLDRARAIETMFGKFQFARISTLLQNVTKDGTQASKVLELSAASAADLANLSKQELGTTATSAMNKFKGSVEKLKLALVPIGETLLKTVSPIIDFISKILDKFNNLSSGVKKAIIVLTVAVGAIGPIALMTFGLLANGFANVMKGAMVLRNGYLKLTGQSKNLGEQTQYLNNEQIDAAAVAHSLDQSHAKLTQTFDVEASSVARLVAAYKSAIVAGEQFAFSNPGMMRRGGKKLATGGIVSGPGTGTSDSIPAMLSNGESVIPAKQTSKYRPLIQGIISDNLPGFRAGRIGSGSEGRRGKANTTVLVPYKTNVSQTSGAVNFGDINPNSLADIASMYAQEIMKEAKVSLANVNSEIKQWETLNRSLINEATNAVNSGVDASKAFDKVITKFNTDMESAGGAVNKFAKTAKQMAPKLQQDLIQAQTKSKELNLNVKSASDAMALSGALPNNIIANKMTKPGSFGSLSRIRSAASSMFGGIAGIAQRGIPGFMVTPGIATNSIAYGARASQEHFSRTLTQEQNLSDLRTSQSRLRQQAIDSTNMAINATAQAAQVASPSRRTIKIGKEIADGLKVGMQEQTSSVAEASAVLTDKAIKASQSRLALYGNGPIDANQKSLRRQLENQQKRATISDLTSNAIVSPQSIDIIKKNAAEIAKSNARMASLNKALVAGSFAMTSLTSVTSMFGGTLGAISQKIVMLSGAFFALTQVVEMTTKQSLLNLVTSRAKGAAGALDIAKSAAAEGSLLTRSGIGGGLARAGFLVTKFLGPIGIATTAISLFALAVKLGNDARERERQKIEGLGNAADISAGQLSKLGKVFGVTPFQGSLETYKPQVIVNKEQRSLIEQARSAYKDDKSYQNDVTAIKKASSAEATRALTARAMKIYSAGFTMDQTKAIIQSMQEDAGKVNLKIDFKSIELGSKEGKAGLKKTTDKLVTEYADAFKKGFSHVKVLTGNTADDFVVHEHWSEALLKKRKEAGSEIAVMLTSLNNQFKQGLISSTDLTSSFDGLYTSLSSLTGESGFKLMEMILASINPEWKKSTAGITNLADQFLILKANMAGLDEAKMARLIVLLKALENPNNSAMTREVLQNQLSLITNLIPGLFGGQQTANKTGTGTIPPGGNTGPRQLTPLQDLQARLKAMKDQSTVLGILRSKNVDYATALDMSNDATMRSLVLDAAKKGTLNKIIPTINQLTAATKAYNAVQDATQTSEERRVKQLTDLQAQVALNEKLIDMQYAPQINLLTNPVNGLIKQKEAQVQAQQNLIDSFNKNNIQPLQDKLTANNLLLDGIALKEDAINKKYNDQIDALTKIENANQAIANIQKQRLSLSDALTQGDISGAAQMVQDIRAQQSQDAITNIKNSLTTSKDQQLAALGRVQLEQQNKELQYQISVLQNTQLATLEKQKAQLDLELQSLNAALAGWEETVAKAKATATYSGLTATEIDNQATLIDLANKAGIPYESTLGKAAQNAWDMAKALQAALAAQLALNSGTPLSSPTASNIITTAQTAARAVDGQSPAQAYAADKIAQNAIKDLTALKGSPLTGAQVVSARKQILGYLSTGGLVPQYFAAGGYSRGTDTVPAMLTPGEFVMNKTATSKFLPILRQLNQGSFPSGLHAQASPVVARLNATNTNIDRSVYNYSLHVTANSNNANPDDIARTVIAQIKRVDSQRIRGNAR